jgi:hypothetical protein
MFNGIKYMQCWSGIQPHGSCRRQFFVPTLNAFIGIGEYIEIVRTSDNSRDAPVARIIDIVHGDDHCHLLINWYFRAPQTSADCLDHRLSNYCKSQEIVQSRWLEWVHSSRVNNICFLFHFSDIVKGVIDCGGIKNAFFIRSQEEGENEGALRYTPLQEHDHISFFSRNGMTYSEQIWCSLKTIQDHCKKTFCRMAAGQS